MGQLEGMDEKIIPYQQEDKNQQEMVSVRYHPGKCIYQQVWCLQGNNNNSENWGNQWTCCRGWPADPGCQTKLVPKT